MAAPRTLNVDPDITTASTLPGWVYSDPELFERSKERVFARSWQLVADTDRLRAPGQVVPFTLLEGLLDEPLVLTRDDQDRLHCVSNVCTHRANLVVDSEGVERVLRCRYHGRRFGLDGRFLSMPGFEGAAGFPSPADDLRAVALEAWTKFVFVSLAPERPLADFVAAIESRCGFLPFGAALFDASRSREYLVRAHWALYCDNYLEGFHVPYVHSGLSAALDEASYATELFPGGSLQVGITKESEDAFELPASSPDHGRRIGAYYFWLFPNTMLNVYPWGVSVNVVRPLAVDRTRVSFLSYVWDPARLDRGAGSSLDRVEREDEVIVESVQRGARSRFYDRGRYSPTREQGVHHFHRLLAAALADA